MIQRPDEERSVLARVHLLDPLPGCTYALQQRDGSIDQAQVAGEEALVFTAAITLRLTNENTLDPSGLHVHGPRNDRFLYVCSGTLAGETRSCWTRRAKVPLQGIDTAVPKSLDAMPPLIEAAIAGRARDGGPACASVSLVEPWKLA